MALRCAAALIATLVWLAAFGESVARAQPDGYRLTYQDDFETGADGWTMTDPAAWRVTTVTGGHVLSQYRQSNYSPPYRSPLNIALADESNVGDFILTVRVKSTIPDYNHRDVSLFFGYQDSAHFYYAHLGKTTDDRANQIFIVNQADRAKISFVTSNGTPWDNQWHDVKIERTVADGTINVFFDNMQTPVMQAVDTTFQWGRVGLGTFDDTADFDDVRLYVPATAGDINLDAAVDRTDAYLFAQQFGLATNSTWTTGDFDGNDATTLSDLVLLKQNYGSPGSGDIVALGAETTDGDGSYGIPEPDALSLALLVRSPLRYVVVAA